MSYLMENYERLAKITKTETLDGSLGISEREKIAIAYAANQYEGVDLEKLPQNRELVDKIKADIVRFYKLLEGKKPTAQVVYIDFSEFDVFYKDKIKPLVGYDLPVFKQSLLQWIESYFVLPDSKIKLNIKFVTTKPPEGTRFIRIALSPKSFFDFINSNDEMKVRFVRAFYSDPDDKTIDAVNQVATKVRYDPKKPTKEAALRLANHPDFQKVVKPSTEYYKAYTLLTRREEFGNQVFDEVVYFDLKAHSQLFQGAVDLVSGRTKLPSGQMPNPIIVALGRNISTESVPFIAQCIVHEVGHALGLDHPHAQWDIFRIRKNGSANIPPAPSNNIMYQSQELGMAGVSRAGFSDFALDYFKFILGAKK